MKNTEYLNRVLNKWGEFCRTHKNIEKAIRELLEENQQLKAENKKLKIRLNSMYGKTDLKGGTD